MSQNTRTQNSGQDANPRRNNPSQYNLRPLRPQVEEQEGNEPLPAVERRAARHQSHRETKIEHLEHHIDTLTELVNTLVAVLGRNTANMALVIPPRIPPANTEGKEAIPSQEDRDTTASEARTDTISHQRCARRRRQNAALIVCENREPTPESHKIEHTRDSIFNKLKRPMAN